MVLGRCWGRSCNACGNDGFAFENEGFAFENEGFAFENEGFGELKFNQRRSLGRRIGVPIKSHASLTGDPDVQADGLLINTGGKLSFMTSLRQYVAMLCVAAFTVTATAAFGQSGGKPAEPQKPSADSAIKEGQKKADEIAEATRLLVGPAGNPECVWLGRRIVSLLWRDDLDTAFRHLDLYDRFGCPSAHIQATFRCLVRQGNIDPKAPETLNGRVHACWLNPGMSPASADAAAKPAAATPDGTTKP